MTRDDSTTQPGTNEGLYDPSFEHDACGVGLICRISGRPSHRIVEQGLQILANLDHRGARGSDPNTGDGAGILVQVPHRFLQGAARREGFSLPDAGDYGVGMLFMSRSGPERSECIREIERLVAESGMSIIGWRSVETENESLGTMALATEPSIWQVFVGRSVDTNAGADFERALFGVRRSIERSLCGRLTSSPGSLYIASLSSRTIVYKGMLTTDQLRSYYPDLTDPSFESALALVHSRFSTNTLPEWRLAQPFRYLCHNGEINTLRGNLNWMSAREPLLSSDLFQDDISDLFPILQQRGSDSQVLDNAAEFLTLGGRSLPRTMMTLIPEAWERDQSMDPLKRAFYEYSACLMEAWDGPAVIPFSDGRFVGAVLDRNGLRPGRYVRTSDGLLLLASEAGVLDLDEATVIEKGRLQPGQMLLADLKEQRIITDYEVKHRVSSGNPYARWISENLKRIDELVPGHVSDNVEAEAAGGTDELSIQQSVFGYTREDVSRLIDSMSTTGKPPIGSMGNDTPLAVLSNRSRLLYDYFKQLFAQVTNPPLDAIREQLVTSTGINLGARCNLLDESADHARQIRCDSPILTGRQLQAIREIDEPGLKAAEISTVFAAGSGGEGLERAVELICEQASNRVADGCSILILSDRHHSA